MRIASVLLTPQVGGAETLEAALVARWRAEGHDVTTLYLDPPGASTGQPQRVARLRRGVTELAPDVVHAHTALPALYARLASRGTWPVVTVLHSAGENFAIRSLRWAERAVQRWTDHVVAINPGQVEEYRRLFGSRTPVTLVPNGVRDDLVPRTSPAEKVRVAGALNRLVPQKRVDVLLAGWTRAALPDAELRVAGVAPDDATRAQVQRWADDAPAARLVGGVSDVPGFLADTDLLVHAADFEGHPLAPLEAAVAGIPVVVSDRVAATVPELAVTAFRAGDADDLAATLRAVAEDYPRLARRAVEAAPALQRRLSLAACADGHMRVLQSARDRTRRPAGR
ncbi:glycosyltransferase family 4 protein [Actinomycetospora sp. C-140]